MSGYDASGGLRYDSDPAHLFMQLYDGLDKTVFRNQSAMTWAKDVDVQNSADLVEQAVLVNGVANYDELKNKVTGQEKRDLDSRGKFTLLLGLDDALFYANPWSNISEEHGLARIASRYAKTGLFNDPETGPGGALLPRCTMHGKPLGGSRREDYFKVHRIEPRDWDNNVDYKKVPPEQDPSFNPESALKVACVPLVQTYDELALEIKALNGSEAAFGVGPVNCAEAATRIWSLIDRMDKAGARLAVVPEGCLSNELLDLWTNIAHESFKPNATLRWLLLGSGPLDGETPPVNRTVLLDRATGKLVFEYDKRKQFVLDRRQIDDWHLNWPATIETATEYITTGERIAVRESGLGRLAALICEDLSDTHTFEHEFSSYGVSHILVPIFSKPIVAGYWEQKLADHEAEILGSWTVISNSLAVANACIPAWGDWARSSKLYTCLVSGPYDRDRRKWGRNVQYGKAMDRDDLGWNQETEELPYIYSGGVNLSWYYSPHPPIDSNQQSVTP